MRPLSKFLVVLALVFTNQSYAQSWSAAGEQTPTYPAITNNNASPAANSLQTMAARIIPRIGDGSNAWGGTRPSAADQPAQVDNPASISTGLVDESVPTSSTGTDEHKFRTVCAVAGVGQFDPIRGFGQKPYGHLHTFFGASNFSESSTYTTLRNSDGNTSTCPGRGLNNSLYWAPSVLVPNAAGSGNTMIKKPIDIILYYVDQQSIVVASQYDFFLRGEKMIAGMNMGGGVNDGPGGTDGLPPYVVTELATANASNVYGTYQAGNHNVTWYCNDLVGGVRSARYLRDPAGNDALNNCPSSAIIYAEITGPSCIDPYNLTSPDGYKHARYAFTETGYSTTDVCPIGWYKKPTIITKWEFAHQGYADYMTWTCSSDAAASAAAGRTMGACESYHVDWMNGWDERVSDLFQTECVAARASSTYYGACNNSTVTATGGTSNGPRSLYRANVVPCGSCTGSQVAHYFAIPTYNGTGAKQRLRMFTDASGGKMASMGAQAAGAVDHDHMMMEMNHGQNMDVPGMVHRRATPQETANNQALSDLIDATQKRNPGPQTQQIWIAIRDAARARDAKDQAKFDTNVALAKQRLAAPDKAAPPMPLFAKLYRAWGAYTTAAGQASIRFDRFNVPGAKQFVYKAPPQIEAAKATVTAIRTCRNPKCPSTVQINDAIKALTLEANSIQSMLPAPPK